MKGAEKKAKNFLSGKTVRTSALYSFLFSGQIKSFRQGQRFHFQLTPLLQRERGCHKKLAASFPLYILYRIQLNSTAFKGGQCNMKTAKPLNELLN
jgi:hypothetical protein